MRKGKGELTHKQLKDENKRLRIQLTKALNELHGMTAAHNNLLKKLRADHGTD